jgi:hypothetical protein
MARPLENHPPERRNPATAATVHGAFVSPDLGGSRQPGIYRTGGVVATVLVTIHDEAGRFQGWETAR